MNSGTSALHLALIACGIGPGDEVITVPMTFVATAWAISYVGARPAFVDIEPHTYTMDAQQVERAVTPHTRALLPAHLYGQTAALGPLLAICERHGLVLVEDAAQAYGAEYDGARAGGVGRVGCFSSMSCAIQRETSCSRLSQMRASARASTIPFLCTSSRPMPTLAITAGIFQWPRQVAQECLSLPMYVELNQEQQAYIAASLKQALET